ncbi:hypothetical protein SAMN05444285_1625 [Draconibacterium orientale]|uniref:Uncharacterized protein n=1 Tax=Draconibacterium orientale TaxID=1168034 RepID=X5E6S6_9BACT|nr:hypothetical protein [Draconibacterium orientale]AHW62331.1 hypothetical protein FH5T_19810 [Draconibacterium orientale]SEU15785.1 hypothetical protein SAMN05444285_1625 [Draconibacterium orientale]
MKDQKARAYITGLFKIVGTDSVLVVLYTGHVKRVHCPFTVIAKVDVPPLVEGKEYIVHAVKMTLHLQDVFIIDGKAYLVWYFAVKV